MGNAKDASGCHKPGYPVPPGSSCPPHHTRRILHASSNNICCFASHLLIQFSGQTKHE